MPRRRRLAEVNKTWQFKRVIPLAERLRPKKLEDWVGQEHLLGTDGLLRAAFERDEFFSCVLYAPPGVGKTSLCRLIKQSTKKNRVVLLNAVTSGVKEVREVIEGAQLWKRSQGQGTILIIDEIHRFNKAQQDSLLGAVEAGDVILIGATTENPSYELNAALLSRLKVLRLDPLSKEQLRLIADRAIAVLKEDRPLEVEEEALQDLADFVAGDARLLLNLIERASPKLTKNSLGRLMRDQSVKHDRQGDLHHQIVSAYIKSMRAGETEAALYYLARLWIAGEDPLYMARRMMIFASEDIGNADLRGLAVANAIRQSVEFVGRPECYYALAQGTIFLSRAAKSREAGDMFQKALEKAERYGAVSPPPFLMNQRTPLDKELGRGRERLPDESFEPQFPKEL